MTVAWKIRYLVFFASQGIEQGGESPLVYSVFFGQFAVRRKDVAVIGGYHIQRFLQELTLSVNCFYFIM
jgi:hypothetical protein